ncbi:sigma-70 family RNA polymerase sigma factor [Leptolyngbya ohadii]|uniref:sigma-70 family RNA polymerase sigma factor n=1 Tax=Leptolyngbya ohadii TaxID=1962290 RepID=UPI000B59A545|nr:sigma-70 family RNA polymerase sigma factor [Leptolyngbya ohadii]
MNAHHRAEQIWAYYRRRISGDCDDRTLIKLRNQIAISNDGLARKAARKMQQRCNEPFEDLHQLAILGMLKGIQSFDPSKGVAFSSYIVPFCEGAIKHHLRDHKHLIKSPRRWQEKSDEARAIQQKLAKQGNRLIELDEIATTGMGIDRGTWQAIAHATQHKPLASLDDDDAIQVADPHAQNLEEAEEREAIRAATLQAIAQLPQLAQECLIEKFWGCLPDAAIAKRHCLTPAQLQTLLTDALSQLRSIPC